MKPGRGGLRLFRRKAERAAPPPVRPDLPPGTDWSWRPALWSAPLEDAARPRVASGDRIGGDLALYHDCPLGEIALRQTGETGGEDAAPQALTLEVGAFEGSFLSLALDLPDTALPGLRRDHLLQLDARIEGALPAEPYARLNVRHGPNTEQLLRALPLENGTVSAAFDLFYTELDERRVEQAWLDLILDVPAQSSVTLHDLTLCRYPRARI